MLQLVQESINDGRGIMKMEEAVWRVTGDRADWFNVEAGKIREGDRADVVILDPEGFSQNLEEVHWADMENFDLQRLVNRNPGLVQHVIINGKLAVENEHVVPALGKEQGFGTFLSAS